MLMFLTFTEVQCQTQLLDLSIILHIFLLEEHVQL